MNRKNLGDLLASDDEVQALKPKKRGGRPRKTAAPEVAAAPVPAAPPAEKRVTIILEENDEIPPTGQYISCNGRPWLLRPGEPADVPEALVSVLNDAVKEVPQIDPNTRQILGFRKRLRFPYRVVNLATA